MKLAILLMVLTCGGCAPHHQVYGVAGPGLQDNIYHPQEDPLFKGDK